MKTRLLDRLLRLVSVAMASSPTDFRTGCVSPPKETVRVRLMIMGDSLTALGDDKNEVRDV
jgi:hypothetical protein